MMNKTLRGATVIRVSTPCKKCGTYERYEKINQCRQCKLEAASIARGEAKKKNMQGSTMSWGV